MARCVGPAAGHERTEAVLREIADIIGGHINAGRLSDGEAVAVATKAGREAAAALVAAARAKKNGTPGDA